MTPSQLLNDNLLRRKENDKPFDPITGKGAPGERSILTITDYAYPKQWVPKAMMENPFINKLKNAGSLQTFIERYFDDQNFDEAREMVIRKMTRLRATYDFYFWAFVFARIKPKAGGENIPFRLNRPQRKLIHRLEIMRLNNLPIRLILLKARQWGGSTAIQMYMAWIQLLHKTGWNSIVVAHVRDASLEVKGMFTTLLNDYPLWLLHDEGEEYEENEKKIISFQGAQNIDIVPQRNNKIKIGTAERPDSARGGDSALVHCTEVAFWVKTENKTPEQIVRSSCSGVLYAPLTMEIFESTANGTGNYFHQEWERAKRNDSDKEPLFVPWFEIEMYEIPLDNPESFAESFCKLIVSNTEDGKFYQYLWRKGATLEAINWYMHKRKEFDDRSDMAAEYPSDDIEAFKHSGARVFNQYRVEELRPTCKAPEFVGEVYGELNSGKEALKNLRFSDDVQGNLKIWEKPDTSQNISNRYVTIVDVGGRSTGSDYSVILVLDRIWLMEGEYPEVVAEWHGHIDHDLLAWKAAQIAAYYNNSLLVIESNTMETRDKDRDTDGVHTSYILNEIADHYRNLYARKQSDESIAEGAPRKWGFHTNTSTKPMIIDHLVKIIREGAYIERETACLDEYLTYEKKQNGSFGAIPGKHDDRLMTRAIGLFIAYCEMDMPKERVISTTKRTPKVESLASF